MTHTIYKTYVINLIMSENLSMVTIEGGMSIPWTSCLSNSLKNSSASIIHHPYPNLSSKTVVSDVRTDEVTSV